MMFGGAVSCFVTYMMRSFRCGDWCVLCVTSDAVGAGCEQGRTEKMRARNKSYVAGKSE